MKRSMTDKQILKGFKRLQGLGILGKAPVKGYIDSMIKLLSSTHCLQPSTRRLASDIIQDFEEP